jgi:alkylation response protein AidB-like acyl-CoA dehydrogenase
MAYIVKICSDYFGATAMDTALDETELAVQETFARFFANQSPTSVVRAAEPLGFDRVLWRRLLDLGALRMALPEAVGGDAASMVCVALVAEQLGRCIAPVPLIDSVAAGRALAGCDEVAARDALERMLRGDEVITLSPRPIVDGVARLVPNGAVADRIVAMNGGSLVLAEVRERPDRAAGNLGSMPLADCVVGGEPVVIAEGAAATTAITRALTECKALLSAALVGMADRSIEIALAYVKVRHAFGTLIGSFQTVSHRLANDVAELDGARLLSYEAAWALDDGATDADALSSMAFAFAAEVARESSGDSLHVHGGVGFTLEHDIQLYFRRAKAWPLAYTSLEDEYQHLADLLHGPKEQVH